MNQSFKLPEGMKDLVLEQCSTKKSLQNSIENCFKKWGYKEVITPTIEYYSTYQLGFDELNEEEAYKFFDSKGKILMLRADMTIPIARVVASKFQSSKKPLRFYYVSNVFKNHASLHGMQDEVTDCGVELIGEKESVGEIEIIATALDTLSIIKDKSILFEIGNIDFFRSACRLLNLSDKDTYTLSRLIGDKSLIELDHYLQSLHIQDKYKRFFKQLPWLCGDAEILEIAKTYCFDDSLLEIIIQLQTLNNTLNQLGYQDIHFDLGKTTNIDYYTGLIFEAFVEGVGTRILSGGSYNKLLGKYGSDLNATGFSIKLDSLLEVVELREKQPMKVVVYPSHLIVDAINLSKQLRTSHVVKLELDDQLNEVIVRDEACCQ